MRILLVDDHPVVRQGIRTILAERIRGAVPRVCRPAGPAPPAAAHEALSDREDQVLRLLAAGHSVSDIARDLGLSVKTVSTYRGRMLDKLGMKTNADVVRYAIQSGLLDA